MRIIVLLITLFIAGCQQKPIEQPSVDPVSSMKEYASKLSGLELTYLSMMTDWQIIPVFAQDGFVGPRQGGPDVEPQRKAVHKWYKSTLKVEQVSIDVRKTDSLVAPLVGYITFSIREYQYAESPNAESAFNINDNPRTSIDRYISTFAWRGDSWEFTGVNEDPSGKNAGTLWPFYKKSFGNEFEESDFKSIYRSGYLGGWPIQN